MCIRDRFTTAQCSCRLVLSLGKSWKSFIYAIVLIVMMLFNWAPKAIEWREKHLSFKKNKKEAA